MIKTIYCDDNETLVVFGKDHIDFMYQMFRKAKEQGLLIKTEDNLKTNTCKFCGNGEIVNLKNNNLLMREKINHNMGCLIPLIDTHLMQYINNISCDVLLTPDEIEQLIKGLNIVMDTIDLSSLDNIKLLQFKGLIAPLVGEIERGE